MQTLGERTKTSELLDIATRVTTVGTYGSKVLNRVGFLSSLCILHSAASTAGSSVTLDVKMQDSDVTSKGYDNTTGAASVDNDLRDGTASNIELGLQFSQSGARQIKSVWLNLKKKGTITTGKVVTVQIHGDSGGEKPDDTLVHADATATVETDDIAATYGLVEFELTRPVDLADSTEYWIVLEGDYDVSSSNCISLATTTVASGGNFNWHDADWDSTMVTTKKGVAYTEQYNFGDITDGDFDTVSELAASFQKLDVELKTEKTFIRALATVAVSSASFICGVSIVLGEASDMPVSG